MKSEIIAALINFASIALPVLVFGSLMYFDSRQWDKHRKYMQHKQDQFNQMLIDITKK